MFHDNRYKQKLFQANLRETWPMGSTSSRSDFNLICFVQDMLRDFRYNKTRQPWIRTKSTDVSSTCLVLVTWALAQNKLD